MYTTMRIQTHTYTYTSTYTDEKYSAIICGNRRAEYFSGKKHCAIVVTEQQNLSGEKHSGLVVAKGQKFSLVRKKLKFCNCGSRTAEVCPKTK